MLVTLESSWNLVLPRPATGNRGSIERPSRLASFYDGLVRRAGGNAETL
jgi:hypothetical protein